MLYCRNTETFHLNEIYRFLHLHNLKPKDITLLLQKFSFSHDATDLVHFQSLFVIIVFIYYKIHCIIVFMEHSVLLKGFIKILQHKVVYKTIVHISCGSTHSHENIINTYKN